MSRPKNSNNASYLHCSHRRSRFGVIPLGGVLDPVQITELSDSVRVGTQLFLLSGALSSLSLSWADETIFLELIEDVFACLK